MCEDTPSFPPYALMTLCWVEENFIFLLRLNPRYMSNLKYSLGIFPEGLRKWTTNLIPDSQHPGRDLNLRSPVYEQESYPLELGVL
jgi:hypothetical protein